MKYETVSLGNREDQVEKRIRYQRQKSRNDSDEKRDRLGSKKKRRRNELYENYLTSSEKNNKSIMSIPEGEGKKRGGTESLTNNQ